MKRYQYYADSRAKRLEDIINNKVYHCLDCGNETISTELCDFCRTEMTPDSMCLFTMEDYIMSNIERVEVTTDIYNKLLSVKIGFWCFRADACVNTLTNSVDIAYDGFKVSSEFSHDVARKIEECVNTMRKNYPL